MLGPGARGRRPPRPRAPAGVGPHGVRAGRGRPPAPRRRPRRGRVRPHVHDRGAPGSARTAARCAAGTVLLDTPRPTPSATPPPRRTSPAPTTARRSTWRSPGRDLRIVDGAYTGDPDAPVGPPTLDAWVRFRQVPDDPYLHAGLLAQFTGHLPIAAALRPHAGVGQDQAHRTLSTAINAIAISFHARGARRPLDALPPPLDLRRRRHDPRGVPGARRGRRAAGVVHRRRHGPPVRRRAPPVDRQAPAL